MRRRRARAALLALAAGVFAVGGGLFVAHEARREPERIPAPPDVSRPNLLVIDIDSLAIGHLGAQRDGRPVTPVLDAVAAEGVTFTHAISQAGWTLPALYAALTGTLPVPMMLGPGGVATRPAGVRDLAEITTIYGYSTAVLLGGTLPGTVRPAVLQSFATLSTDEPPGQGLTRVLTTAVEPFFVYAHEIDMHDPHAMPDAGEATRPTESHGYRNLYEARAAEIGAEAARAETSAHYDEELHQYDAALAPALQALRDRGAWDHTIVVVLSDHGEDLFDHTVFDHGRLYDSTLRVPLVVRDPTSPARGVTVDTVVQTVDLAPTLLGRAGIPVAASMVGRSLAPLLGAGGDYEERPVFSLSSACDASWRTATAKVIVSDGRPPLDPEPTPWRARPLLAPFVAAHHLAVDVPDCSHAHRPSTAHDQGAVNGPLPTELAVELYDLVADPHERDNLVERTPERALPLLTSLLTAMAERRAVATGAPREALTPEQIQRMKDQGYWGMVQGTSNP